MKTTNLFKAFAISFILTIASFGQAQENNLSSAGDTGYMLFQQINKSSDCVTIKFCMKEDGYTKIYVRHNSSTEKIILVDGDVTSGLHGIAFKYDIVKYKSSDYNCFMEVYNENGDMVYMSRIGLE